jgi:hypothetical protein
MSINLTKFTEKKEVIVPVRWGRFQYNRKRYGVLDSKITSVREDRFMEYLNGWCRVIINGNDAYYKEDVFIEAEPCVYDLIKGYTFHNKIIFQNFDVAKRKLNADMMGRVFFIENIQSFSAIEAVIWEDGNLYFYRPNYIDSKIIEVQQAFRNEQSITHMKGVTPEQQTVYLFHELELQRIKAEQERIRLQEEKEAFQKTLEGRLLTTFERAGAVVISYEDKLTEIEVVWQLSNGQEFNSRIEKDTFKVIELGYCASGDDKSHNATSMVKLAESYDAEGLLYRTRR